MFLAEVLSTSQEVTVFPVTLAVLRVMEEQTQTATLVTLQTTSKTTQGTVCASLDITEAVQCALNAILVATSAITLETLTVLLVLTKEVHQTNVVHQESTITALLVKLVQPMSTLTEVAV